MTSRKLPPRRLSAPAAVPLVLYAVLLYVGLAFAGPASARAQAPAEVVDFEAFALPERGYLNGSERADPSTGGYEAGGLFLPNTYSEAGGFVSWTGWSISDNADATDPAFTNQYSAFPGGGAEGTDQFAVAFGSTRLASAIPGAPVTLGRAYVANSTYAALVMRDGNQFSKRFGGVSGADPDFLSVTFTGYAGGGVTDSLTVFLGDYRADDPADDYILDEWLAVDMSVLGAVDSVTTTFRGSDVGDFGLNTPAYVLLDQIEVATAVGVAARAAAPAPRVFPSAATETLHVRDVDPGTEYAITDLLGRGSARGITSGELPVAHLPPGAYAVRFRQAGGAWTRAARFFRVE